ncbi:hypothetical protein D3C86_1734970 [compost metagenome]
MKVRVHERRRHQLTGRIDALASLGLQHRFHRRNTPLRHTDVDIRAAIGQRAILDDQVEHGWVLAKILNSYNAAMVSGPARSHGAGSAGPSRRPLEGEARSASGVGPP